MAGLRLGCAGWSTPEWVGPFYPPGMPGGLWLEAYSRVFDFAEVDGTFYELPSRERVQGWADRTPQTFTFSPKLTRRITHGSARGRELLDVDEAVGEFLMRMAPLRAVGKLGPVVAQFAETFARTPATSVRFEAFARAWPRDQQLAVELRHPSWWTTRTLDVLRDVGAALVLREADGIFVDMPTITTGAFVYVRFIGDRALDDVAGGPRFDKIVRDKREAMRHRKNVVRAAIAAGFPVFAVMNNHLEGYAPESTRRLATILETPLPNLAAARGRTQRGLLDF